MRSNQEARAILTNVVAVAVAIVVPTYLVTAKHDVLPILLGTGRYATTMMGMVSSVWCLSLAALLVLWYRKARSVLDVWLMVVMCAWLFDVGCLPSSTSAATISDFLPAASTACARRLSYWTFS